MEEETRANAKLKSLPRSVRDELWRMRHPLEEGDKKFTYVECLAWLQKEHGVESSLGALTPYFAWEKMIREMEEAREDARQAEEEMARDPNATPEAIANVGQMVFTSKVTRAGNIKAFVALEKLRLQRIALSHDDRKIHLLEEKARRLDEMEAKAKQLKQGGGLSAETLDMLEKQLKIL